ncbi:M20/M25/M40 family metallo-hydrolase [Ravibacter arvi]|uniref:M20/M25/M40 family metallo-hydrolase n=1 Tax=Ravibacter arvi TaxID=2051041 RepID=A0ABP8LP70_9BACT
MKRSSLLVTILFTGTALLSHAQKEPEFTLKKEELESHLRFLASDELEGRRTGEQSNRVAARYIAEQFRRYGAGVVPGQQTYFQPVVFDKTTNDQPGVLLADGDTLAYGKEWFTISGNATRTEAPVVYAGYGLENSEKGWDDYKGLDVKGKIVLVQSGLPESQSPRESLQAGASKLRLAAGKGAVALIELYGATTPWNFINTYLTGERLGLAETPAEEYATIPHLWVNGKEPALTKKLREAKSLKLVTEGRSIKKVTSYNVMAYIEGSDPKLKDQYLTLSAHYDHVGVGRQGGQPYTAEDSIFNGARDNAFGVSAVLAAARSFSELKPKRSVFLLAFTGEELGLLGSRYYAQNPVLPLNKCVFNLNCDGAGYDDTGIISVIGLDRTGAKAEIEKAAKTFGLEVIGDPAPEQNLFDRSDNVNFAIKGIPAPTFTPGFKEFDADIMKYYHQAIDNPESIDFDYLLRYSKAYVRAARLIANRTTPPQWSAGDKYEEAAKSLYGK